MPDYRTVFPKRATFLVVIHVENEAQALRNARIARDQGADGVFLIHHGGDVMALLLAYAAVRQAHPDWWIGLNFLGLSAWDAVDRAPADVSGLWTDDPGVREKAQDACLVARQVKARLDASPRSFLYFGSAAFKYQPPVSSPAVVAALTAPYVDVVTTSGDATGQPPSVAKVRAMKIGASPVPLAIASGITPENVSRFLGLADAFLVATGISASENELDPKRVRDLADALE